MEYSWLVKFAASTTEKGDLCEAVGPVHSNAGNPFGGDTIACRVFILVDIVEDISDARKCLSANTFMVSSKAKTVSQYLKELPKDRRDELEKVRHVVKKNLGKGFVETMNWGMISYEVPLATYPDTYNGKPLSFAALAAQKHNFSLYLMCIYQSPELLKQVNEGFKEIGKKPNMGKSCIRFKNADEIPLSVIGKVIKKVSLKKFIDAYELVKGKSD